MTQPIKNIGAKVGSQINKVTTKAGGGRVWGPYDRVLIRPFDLSKTTLVLSSSRPTSCPTTKHINSKWLIIELNHQFPEDAVTSTKL